MEFPWSATFRHVATIVGIPTWYVRSYVPTETLPASQLWTRGERARERRQKEEPSLFITPGVQGFLHIMPLTEREQELLEQKHAGTMARMMSMLGEAGDDASPDLLRRMKLMLGLGTPHERLEGLMKKQQIFAINDGRMDAMEYACRGHLDTFLKNRTLAPGVDIGAGCGLYSALFSKRFEKLEMYPTDIQNDAESRAIGSHLAIDATKEAFRARIKEATERTETEPLFNDENGNPVRATDRVCLKGLKRAEFNGREGTILTRRQDGRICVDLGDEEPKAFKAVNIVFVGEQDDDGQSELFSPALLSGLLERVREVDVVDRSTWSNVEHLYSKCAFVLCSSLLTQVGYRAPLMWQDVLQLASKLLAPGGVCILYDATKYGGFGDVNAMSEYIAQHSLMLTWECRWREPGNIEADEDDDDEMMLIQFTKGSLRHRVGLLDEVHAAQKVKIEEAFDHITLRAVEDGLMSSTALDTLTDRLAACSDSDRTAGMLEFLDRAFAPGRRVKAENPSFFESEFASQVDLAQAVVVAEYPYAAVVSEMVKKGENSDRGDSCIISYAFKFSPSRAFLSDDSRDLPDDFIPATLCIMDASSLRLVDQTSDLDLAMVGAPALVIMVSQLRRFTQMAQIDFPDIVDPSWLTMFESFASDEKIRDNVRAAAEQETSTVKPTDRVVRRKKTRKS